MLKCLVDGVDFGVVGNGFEGDVGYALVDKALTDVAVGGSFGDWRAGDVGFFLLAFGGVGEEVVGVACSHNAGTGEGKGDAGGVNGDPAAAPLFGDVGSGTGTTGRI